MNVVVFSASNLPDPPTCQTAHDLGRSIAERGWTTINGGGPGLMDAVLQGAKSASGRTFAIRLARHARNQSAYADDWEASSQLVDRQNRLMARGDAFVALPGGIGTLYEVFQILALKNAGEVPPEVPLILLSDHFGSLATYLTELERTGYVASRALGFFEVATEISICMDRLEAYARHMRET